MRTAGYLSVFLTGAFNPQGKIARDLAVFAKHLSAGRTMMRFFDDLPMLTATIASIKSKVSSSTKDKNTYSKTSLLSSAAKPGTHFLENNKII